MILKGFREINRLAAAEGAVLLKNENNTLPVKNERTAVFGRCQIDYYKSGSGSGGAVNAEYVVNILEGFRKNDSIIVDEEIAALYEELTKNTPDSSKNIWKADFTDYEPVLEDEVVENASKRNEKAIIVLGRVAGEAYDAENVEGSYLLTQNERRLIQQVCRYFEKCAVLLNCGNLINMNWVSEYNVPAVMYIWQAGEEGGSAAADLVSGIVPPSGKLTDTIASDYSKYPSSASFAGVDEMIYGEDIFVGYRYFETFDKDSVIYPFGYGITYTTFDLKCIEAKKNNNLLEIVCNVKNTGEYEGREVVQVYAEGKGGKLCRPARELIGFAKTKTLSAGESTKIELKIDISKTASYDDEGETGFKSAWVIENGEYNIYVGNNVRSAEKVLTYNIADTVIAEQCSQRMTPHKSFKRFINDNGTLSYKNVITESDNMSEHIKNINEINGEYKKDFEAAVRENNIEGFVASMTDAELMTISRGEGMLSPKVTPGVASCFGGVSQALVDKGIPVAATSDGPSGIRMDNGESASSMPNGTLLASSWDPEMVEKLYEYAGKELCLNKIDMLLGPGMNIHRDPLCGRNFEYFSEDPLLCGVIAAANIRGLDNGGSHAVAKHFACNNRECERTTVNSVVSERALREIYLRGFEIAVKTSPLIGIMTSYNLINEYHSASNYDLTTALLRDEWGYDGLVMTDWWADMNYDAADKGERSKQGALVRAQNDLYMVVNNDAAENWNDDLQEKVAYGTVKRSELQRNAVNILKNISRMLCFERKYGFRNKKSCNAKWFKTETEARSYNLIHCEVPEITEKKKVYCYMDSVHADEGIKQFHDAVGAPGSSICIQVKTGKVGAAVMKLNVRADISELAQLAIYVKSDKNDLAVPMCGTNNKIITLEIPLNLIPGENFIGLDFAKTNSSEINLESASVNSK